MDPEARVGPVIVCLEPGRDGTWLARCGIALARSLEAPLHLAVVLVLPVQRPLCPLAAEDDQAASALLDIAADLATAEGIVPVKELWVVRSWKEALRRMAEDLAASALVVASRPRGLLAFFEDRSSLLNTAPCPVITVGGETSRAQHAAWPPRWLAEADLQLVE